MKKIIVGTFLGLLLSGSVLAQNLKVKAYYSGFETESNTYAFETEDGEYLEFSEINPEVLTKFSLKTKETGKAFSLEYSSKEVEDEDGEQIEVYKLLKLTPTTIIKKDDDEDEDDDY